MRLTPEHVKAAVIRVNPVGDREINLRGIGIRQLDEGALSHLITTSSATASSAGEATSKKQQAWRALCDEEVDAMDLSDNLLATVDSFPTMRRLHTLILHRNLPLLRISPNIATRLPSLHTIVASGCGFTVLSSLAPLGACRNLERVSFSQCPVSIDANRTPYNCKEILATTPHSFTDALLAEVSALEPSVVYRLYLIAICSSKLKLVDFNRVKDAEREKAKRLKDVLVAVAAATSGSVLGASMLLATPSAAVTADGKKIRKRSTLATGGGVTAVSGAAVSSTVAGNGQAEDETAQPTSSSGGADELTEELINKMRDDLNAKIESASTMEEMTELEEALEQLHAKEVQLKKALGGKRARA